MKKLLCLISSVIMMVTCCFSALAEWKDTYVDAPSSEIDLELADELITLNEYAYNVSRQNKYMWKYGFKTLASVNYDRTADDTRHVCAYSVYKKVLKDGRTVIVIVVRGTGDTEWELNLDIMPSGDYDLGYSENFYLTAKDIIDTWQETFESLTDPVFVVTGHSRGAACANILGAMLDDAYGEDRVYAYNFASPRTVRGEYQQYGNIFNFINECDFVTYLPLPQWGFERYGRDIILQSGSMTAEQKEEMSRMVEQDTSGWSAVPPFKEGNSTVLAFIQALADTGSIADMYNVRYSTAHAGIALEGEEGITVSEFLVSLFAGMLSGSGASSLIMNLTRYKANHTAFEPVVNVLTTAFFKGELMGFATQHAFNTYRYLIRILLTEEI